MNRDAIRQRFKWYRQQLDTARKQIQSLDDSLQEQYDYHEESANRAARRDDTRKSDKPRLTGGTEKTNCAELPLTSKEHNPTVILMPSQGLQKKSRGFRFDKP